MTQNNNQNGRSGKSKPGNVHTRLRALRLYAGYPTAYSFAKKHSIKAVTYRSHENGGRSVRIETAKAYAKFLNCSWKWLLFGEMEYEHPKSGSSPTFDSSDVNLQQKKNQDEFQIMTLKRENSHENEKEGTETPEIGTKKPVVPKSEQKTEGGIIVGMKHEAGEFPSYWFEKEYGRPCDNCHLYKVATRRMEPTLCYGDLVMVDLSYSHPNINGIYAITDKSGVTFKRIVIDYIDKKASLTYDNPLYANREEIPLDELSVAGKVIWFCHLFNGYFT